MQEGYASLRAMSSFFYFGLDTLLELCNLTAMKNQHAVHLGRNGGKARARKLSKKRRSEIARLASNTRWQRYSDRQEAMQESGSPYYPPA